MSHHNINNEHRSKNDLPETPAVKTLFFFLKAVALDRSRDMDGAVVLLKRVSLGRGESR